MGALSTVGEILEFAISREVNANAFYVPRASLRARRVTGLTAGI